ncbi:hypothetical protein JOB18_046289 [Solea senegalensis]|uniref:Uncharacterized protein n=1 Tax=Solea senegalensis TaxID=28829 RepID=A0AAV6R4X4_SOLSE|nr:hypothetical protein JOB18_046289 [Solea senegalensis]
MTHHKNHSMSSNTLRAFRDIAGENPTAASNQEISLLLAGEVFGCRCQPSVQGASSLLVSLMTDTNADKPGEQTQEEKTHRSTARVELKVLQCLLPLVSVPNLTGL